MDKHDTALMRGKDVAALLRVGTRTVVTWRQNGVIPFLRLGRSIRFRRESIEKLLASLERGGNAS